MTPLASPSPPVIRPVPSGTCRPRWSVMIPTYNCAHLLEHTLRSVLVQDQGPGIMQIEVVDDCSTKDDPEGVVRKLAGDRAGFHRKPSNAGAIANFNTCIERSLGEWVHILHGDDIVLPGFYRRVEDCVQRFPSVGLVAVRSFYMDESGVYTGVTDRVLSLEGSGRTAEAFYYATPIQTPGIVVRRAAYEQHGGFLPELVHTADCEMWARITARVGAVVTPEVLAGYRMFAGNDTGRLAKTAENLRDLQRLSCILASRHQDFDKTRALNRVCAMALTQAAAFRALGDEGAARANRSFWKEHATLKMKARQQAQRLIHWGRRWVQC